MDSPIITVFCTVSSSVLNPRISFWSLVVTHEYVRVENTLSRLNDLRNNVFPFLSIPLIVSCCVIISLLVVVSSLSTPLLLLMPFSVVYNSDDETNPSPWSTFEQFSAVVADSSLSTLVVVV